MIYLDTHVVVWLYAGQLERFSDEVQTLLNEHDLRICPIVQLELQYLHEIERITVEAQTILADLGARIGLQQIWINGFRRWWGKLVTFPGHVTPSTASSLPTPA